MEELITVAIRTVFEIVKMLSVLFLMFKMDFTIRAKKIIASIFVFAIELISSGMFENQSEGIIRVAKLTIFLIIIWRKDSIWYMLFAYIFVQVSDSMSAEIIKLIVNAENKDLNGSVIASLINNTVATVILIIICFVIRINIKKNIDKEIVIGLKSYLSLAVVGLVLFFTSAGSRLILEDDVNHNVKTVFVIAFLFMLVVFITMFYFQNIWYNEKRERERLYELQIEIERDKGKYYKEQSNQYEKVKKYKHDNILREKVLENLALQSNDDRIKKFAEELKKEEQADFNKLDCGNEIIGALLLEFSIISRENKIEYDWNGGIDGKLVFSELEIVDSFGNLMKNAVEECLRLDGERKISVVFLNLDDAVTVTIINTCNKKSSSDISVLKSEKNDKENHGMGIKNVNFIVYKYNGASLKMKVEDGFFISEMIIPKRKGDSV